MITEMLTCKECGAGLLVKIEKLEPSPDVPSEQLAALMVLRYAVDQGWAYAPPDFYCFEHSVIVKAMAVAKENKPCFECPDCGATSCGTEDVAERYCGYCHEFKE